MHPPDSMEANTMTEPIPYDHAMRKIYLNFDTDYTPLIHGLFGTYPSLLSIVSILSVRTFVELDRSRNAISSFFNINIDEGLFILNTTKGVNIVLRSLVYENDDVLINFSNIYGGCFSTLFQTMW